MGLQELSHVKADVDYNQIPPIQQKRIIAFVNHFVTNTVSYLNNFCQSCESRFMDFEYKIQKIEASLLILESQLSSIPEFGTPSSQALENNVPKSNDFSPANQTLTLPEVPVPSTENLSPQTEPVAVVVEGKKAIEDERFAKFFKMVRVGVHEQAVKLKMKSEGFDPTILDNPEAIIPEENV